MPEVLGNEIKQDNPIQQNPLKGNNADTILNPKVVNVGGAGLYIVGSGKNTAGIVAGINSTDTVFFAGDTLANKEIAPFRVNLAGNVTQVISKIFCATIFETAARFTRGGTNPLFIVGGIQLRTNGVAGNGSLLTWAISNNTSANVFTGSPTFTATINSYDVTLDGTLFVGIGVPGDVGGVFVSTAAHIGFKIISSGSTATLYGTQADGATEAVSAALTTLAATDTLDLIVIVNGTTSVDYYWRLNGGSLSSVTTVTGNVPTGAENRLSYSIDDGAVANSVGCVVACSSYSR